MWRPRRATRRCLTQMLRRDLQAARRRQVWESPCAALKKFNERGGLRCSMGARRCLMWMQEGDLKGDFLIQCCPPACTSSACCLGAWSKADWVRTVRGNPSGSSISCPQPPANDAARCSTPVPKQMQLMTCPAAPKAQNGASPSLPALQFAASQPPGRCGSQRPLRPPWPWLRVTTSRATGERPLGSHPSCEH